MPEDTANNEAQHDGPEAAAAPEDGGQSEERMAALERPLSARQQDMEKREAELKGLGEQLSAAVMKYRGLMLAGSPEIPAELVFGKTIAEIEASFQAASEVVGRIRKQLEARLAAERVPLGAPARNAPDLSQLSPREKIAHALAQR